MSSGKKDFYGKEVTDAIRKACDTLQAPQEDLAIEVVETGSTGIFGLIRKKAHIRAVVRGDEPEKPLAEPVKLKKSETAAEAPPVQKQEKQQEDVGDPEKAEQKEQQPRLAVAKKEPEPLQAESVETVRHELSELLQLMGFPSDVTAEVDGVTVRCQVSDEHEDALTGQEGKIIDSLQYLLRKVVARKMEQKVRLSIDIGQFREKRKVELMERARELAALVKEDGKTQAIPPLNPSERRIVHVALQDDKDIRSRSVGAGLFKKILIYKPGKGKKPGGKKRGGRGKGNKKPQESSDS